MKFEPDDYCEERCNYCKKDTTHINRNEQGLCDECANNPEVIEDLEKEMAEFASFIKYYHDHELSQSL